jgi:uncharacterized protein (TIGR04255 family)
MSKVTPCNDNNAIKNVAYAFEFANPLPFSIVQEIIEMYRKDPELSKALPRMQPIEALTFEFGAAGNHSQSPSSVGVIFDRLLPNGDQAWALVIKSDALIVSCATYTNWTEIFSTVKNYIKKIANFLNEQQLKAIALEFYDEFNVESLADPEWINELFNNSSKYLSANALQQTGSWHLHQGYWKIIPYKDKHYISLNNIDLSCLEEGVKNIARIRHLQKSTGFEFGNLNSMIESGFFEDLFSISHDSNLGLMRDLISHSMLAKIKLEVE